MIYNFLVLLCVTPRYIICEIPGLSDEVYRVEIVLLEII